MDKKRYQLSQSELGIYTACQTHQGLEYNLPFVVEIPFIGINKVREILDNILSKHSSLYTRFCLDNEYGVAKYQEPFDYEIDEIDYPKDLEKLVTYFDINDSPLFRFKLLNKGKKKYLFFDFHHAIMDGGSIHLFLRDFFDLLNNKQIEKEKVTSYKYSETENSKRKTKQYDIARGYFLKHFDSIETDSIPVYDINLSETKYNHVSYRLNIDKKRLSRFKDNLNIKTSSFFSGVYAYLFKNLSGNNDAFFLSINNGRNNDLLNTYGMFVKTFPVYAKFEESDLIKDFLIKLNDQIYNTVNNSIYSYSDLVKDLSIKSEAMFAYQGDAYYRLKNVSAKEIKTSDGKEKLSIEVFRDNEGYYLNIEYRADLFLESSILNICNLFDIASNEFLSKKYIKNINLVSNDMLDKMNQMNEADISYIKDNETIISRFNEVVKKNMDKTCLVFEDKSYTYKEFDLLTNRLANQLVKMKARGVIPVLIDRSEYIAIATYGVLKTGLAYMPLDSTYPTERLEFMINDSNAKLVILDKALEEKIPNYKGKKLYLDDFDEFTNEEPLVDKSKPNDLFVMLYTSGTTGNPKGVLIENRNVLAFSLSHIKLMGLDNTRRVAAYASYGFDANLMDMHPTLLSGATLYIVSEALRLDLINLGKKYDEWEITDAFITTTVGRQFVTEIKNHHLINFGTGGEKLVPFDPKKLKFNFYNMYGPTEGVVYSNAFKVDKLYLRVPIGKKTSDFKIYVVDSNMKRLPFNVPGELVIAGPQVARGYLNRPLANKAFIKNPFDNDKDFINMYKTGDIVRMLPDSTIDFIGRADGQVKIRGFRIELTEVESVIREYPLVKEATVKDFTDNMGIKYLVGYVVSDSKIEFDDLKNFILERKPSYMAPKYFMQLQELPLNQNHKVNKRLLPEPTLTKKDMVLPRNKTEERLFNILKELLGYPVGVLDDLDMAGLTSVSTIRFVVLISKEFNKTIKVSDLSNLHNIEDIAKFISEKEDDVKLKKLNDYPITKTQEGIFVECFSNPNTTMYNISQLVELDDRQDLVELKNAIYKVLDNHKYLNSILFTTPNGDIRIKEGNRSDISIIEVNKLDKSKLVRPFELLNGPLSRIEIYKTDDKNYLFVDFHHIIFDGTSAYIFFNDLTNALNNKNLLKEDLNGFEVAQVEEIERSGELLKKARDFYATYLKDLDDSTSLFKKEPLVTIKPKLKSFDVTPKLDVATVNEFINRYKLSANAFFNTVFGYTLAKFSNKLDTYFTTIFNGRTDSRLTRTTSMLVKTLPIFIKYNEDLSIVETIRTMQKNLMALQANSIYSFSEAVKDYSLNALVMFAYQGDNFEFNKLGKYDIKTHILESDVAKTPLSLDVFIENNKYKFHAEYDTSYYRNKMIQSFVRQFENIANEMISKSFFKDINFLTDKDIELYKEFNQTEAPILESAYYKYLEKAVEANSSKLAVIGKDESYTYKDFNEACNKVAHKLIDLGGKISDKVIMLMPRIAKAYVVREGILKSGLAFVPIDPKYPSDRISYIISDSNAKFLISTKKIIEDKHELFDELKIDVLAIEDILLSQKIDNPNVDIKKEDLAYLIYTSGSTGKPKGVMLSEENLCNYVTRGRSNTSIYEYEKNGPDSVSCSFASFSFDASLQEECVPLSLGHTIYIASEEDIENPMLLAKHLIQYHVDTMFLTPSYVTNILEFEDVLKAFRNFKTLDMGAEAVPVSLCKKLRELGVNADLFNGYGPTETTITSTYSRDPLNGTIGKPMVNTQLYIVDKLRRVLPIGATGELLISGPCVGMGYYNLEEKTKEVFIKLHGKKAYLTGDMARYNEDGDIEFFGRMDNQVKLHGLRIELDEIENNILKYRDITRTKVVVKNNQKEDYLVAYFTAKSEIDTSKLIEFISKNLTPYMVPKVFMQLDKMPLTPNGKIDKKALPEVVEDTNIKKDIVKPSDELEEKILEIFKKALSIDTLSCDDDFFELGGTSLSASKVTMLAMSNKLSIDYKDLFDYPSVILLANHLKEKEGVSLPAKKVSQNVSEKLDQIISLKDNVCENVDKVNTDYKINKVLLTGATGFLGIHLLRDLINENKVVYALVRPDKELSTDDRLKALLAYYFDNPFEEKFGKTLFTIPSDVTSDNLLNDLKDIEFDTIINAAALVKHFAKDDIIEKVNAVGSKNMANVALAHNARLIQISTLSVAGVSVDDAISSDVYLHENELELGQDISNKYVHSKYMAERSILEMIANEGLDAKIIRVGNLMSRNSDGEFQINSITNNFMRTLFSYVYLHAFPMSLMDSKVDFSPIDYVSSGILKLATTNKEFSVYHLSNSHTLDMADVIYALNKYGKDISIVSDQEFTRRIVEASKDPNEALKVSSLIAYNVSDGHTYRFIDTNNTFTTKILYRIGFKWPITDESYLEKAIEAIDTLGFFQREDF